MLDRVLEMVHYDRVARFRVGQALGDLELVHAGPLRVFFQITLRLLLPGVAAGTCFAFIMSFDNLVVSLFLSGPRMKTLPVEIYGYLEYADDPLLAAVSSVVIVGIVLLLIVMEKTVGFTRALVQQGA